MLILCSPILCWCCCVHFTVVIIYFGQKNKRNIICIIWEINLLHVLRKCMYNIIMIELLSQGSHVPESTLIL